MGNYSLQKYKGTATRHTCPKCGDRHSFVYYVDENNVPLHPSVGRCNHESGCGYHYTPKEYFQEHPEHRTTNDFSFDRQRAEQKKVKQQSKPTAIGYIPPHYVEKSQSERSNFFRFLFTLLTSYYGDKAKVLLSGKLQNATNSLSAMPINRRCGLLFGKVSPPFRLSFIGCPLKREN